MKLRMHGLYSGMFVLPFAVAMADQNQTILTDNVVELRETVSPNGFVRPGIGANAETLLAMREGVINGVSPWVDYFEGMRRTRYANLNQRPAFVRQITNDGGIGGFGYDAQLMWVHTILYVVTGNEDYRKTPIDIINWYGSRTEEHFFPQYFSDSHIKIGKHVNTFCGAVDILRATNPPDGSLAVTQEMVDAVQKNCLHPIRKTCIERNDYFMNQHSYSIVGFLASTILGEEVEDYAKAVEWVTVNATSPNQGRNGAIKQQIRLVTRNDATGEAVEPNLQLVEMGRDMPHADGNINYLMTMSKAIDFQKTKVDPVDGTVTDKADGVAPVHFLDNRLPHGAALYAKFNMGYGLRWVPTYAETDPNHPDYGARYDYISPRGRGAFGSSFHYYYLKGAGINMESGPFRFVKAAFDAVAAGREGVRSGVYLDSVHNYCFDFWIGLPANVSDAAPDPAKAKRALAMELPPLEVTYQGRPLEGRQFEYSFLDLSAHAEPGDVYPGSPDDIPLKVLHDDDGTGYVRMTVENKPRTMMVHGHFPKGSGWRVRSDSPVTLSFYNDEKSTMSGDHRAELFIPDTKGEWVHVIIDFEGGMLYTKATPLQAGTAIIDFDRIETETEKVSQVRFNHPEAFEPVTTHAGVTLERSFQAAPENHLRGGAEWVSGRAGQALRLNGHRQYVRLQEGIVSDLEDFSVSAWIKLDHVGNWARVFDFGDSRENYMFLTVSDGRVPRFSIRTPRGGEQVVQGNKSLQRNVWHHVAVTLSGNTAILYVDGKEAGRNGSVTHRPSSLGKTRQNYIGRSQFPDPFLAGTVEHFLLYNTALDADMIQHIHSRDRHIAADAPGVHYSVDPATFRKESAVNEVLYTVRNLPAGANFNQSTGAFRWRPSARQAGTHRFYVTAVANNVANTRPVNIHVASDLQAALDHVAAAYDPAERYVTATEEAFKAALATRDPATLKQAVEGLEHLNPRLPDGTLDYRMATNPRPHLSNINMMADNDPFTWSGVWGFDKNITLDFGKHFKVRSDAFRMLPRDGHPGRMVEAVVYGSNDGWNWTLLTQDKTACSSSWQTLRVKEEEQGNAWVPNYTLHKVLAGLRDAYRLAGSAQALQVERDLADYLVGIYEHLSPAQAQEILKAEFGGLNEVFADLTTDTGDPKYLRLAETVFHHDVILDPLKQGHDNLDGKHGNTQVPKLVGLARDYLLSGDPADLRGVDTFWSSVVHERSFANGGHGDHEHFFPPRLFPRKLGPQNAETCNTYNMIKLAGMRFSWAPDAADMDFVERALINHILANIGREPGEFGYFLPLGNVAYKTFSTPHDAWWCCVGTGMENPQRYAEHAYFHHDRTLWVNLYLASRLDWPERSFALRQETAFPDSDAVRLVVEAKQPVRLALKLRHPYWCAAPEVMINGDAVALDSNPSSYFTLEREWRDGDTIELRLPMTWRTEPLPHSDGKIVALMYGPMQLVALVPSADADTDPARRRYGDHLKSPGRVDSAPPVLVAADTAALLASLRPEPAAGFAAFRAPGVLRPDYPLVPFHRVYQEHYAAYFPLYTPADWAAHETKVRAAEAARIALDAATIDRVEPGFQQSEVEHKFASDKSETGDHRNRKWRDALPGGWFSYRMAVSPDHPVALVTEHWGGDRGRSHELWIDGHRIPATLRPGPRDAFFEAAYAIPPELTRGKREVTVRLVAAEGRSGTFGLRIVDQSAITEPQWMEGRAP